MASHFTPDEHDKQETSRIVQLARQKVDLKRDDEASFREMMAQIRHQLTERYEAEELEEASPKIRQEVEDLVRSSIEELAQSALASGEPALWTNTEAVLERALNEIFGLGPLQPLLGDPAIEEISINGPDCVITRGEAGRVRHPIFFSGPEELVSLVNRGIASTGRKLDTANPWVDGRLSNGARLHASTYPIAEPWPAVSIRLHRLVARTLEDLVRLGTVTPSLALFLEAVVRSRLAVLITGGTRTGKTNFINVLSGLIDPAERIVVIEDTRELQIPLEDVVYLMKRTPGPEGAGAIDQQLLVANALRMSPDRIILAEARDRAAFDMLKAANTGHEGTMATVHANSAEEAISRLEVLAYESPDARNLSQRSLRSYIAGGFQYVVLLQRLPESTKRRVSQVLEIPGSLEGDTIRRHLIFESKGEGLRWTGIRPHFESRMREHGYEFERILAEEGGN